MSEVIVKMVKDHVKVNGGTYVRDLVRCEECDKRKLCEYHRFTDVAWCSLGVKEEE